eukprot:931645-Amphidinium_carterae.1
MIPTHCQRCGTRAASVVSRSCTGSRLQFRAGVPVKHTSCLLLGAVREKWLGRWLRHSHTGAAYHIQLEDAIYVQRWNPALFVKRQRALCLATKPCQVVLQNRMSRSLHERLDSCHIFVPWMCAGPPNQGQCIGKRRLRDDRYHAISLRPPGRPKDGI